jgi:hypothetical protein
MLDNLVETIRTGDKDARRAASKALTDLSRGGRLTLDDALRLLRVGAEEWPERNPDVLEGPASMVYAARNVLKDKNSELAIDTLKNCFDRYTFSGKNAALQILAITATPPAASLYVELLARLPAPKDGEFLAAIEFNESISPEVASSLFPSLLPCARDPEIAFSVFHMLLRFRNAGLLKANVLGTHEGKVSEMFARMVEQARRLQQSSGLGWRDEYPYSRHRDMAGLLLDLTGVLDSDSMLETARRAGDLIDPRLRLFRALALLDREVNVPDSELEWIAESPRDRFLLFQGLSRRGLGDRLPRQCLDQSKLAEGHMVDWLCYGTELGREPDEMELIRVESRNRSKARRIIRFLAKRETVDYFFFRFRVTEEHWAKEDGWMVGMAGGYPRRDQPTAAHDGGTFSRFAAWESKSVDDHIRDYLD